jgi:hypothetical protein
LLTSLSAAEKPPGRRIEKFTEKNIAQATPTLSVPTRLGAEPTKSGGRKPSPSLESLPAPKATGPLRILVVDDDASSNNADGDTGKAQRSDAIYRALVTQAVGRKPDAWAVEVVKARDNGPALERLRDFNVVLWYTGGAYGANNDTVGREDEKILRRYLEETGGAVILVSPGYVNNLVYGQSWEAAEHPFLKEVLAVNGCYGLLQRGMRGVVRDAGGTEFQVENLGVSAEAQFSAVNPDGAAIVFTSPLSTTYAKQEGGLPVAVANAFGQGRIVYVGFTFENIPENERAGAFAGLLAAAGVREASPAPSAPLPTVAVVTGAPLTPERSQLAPAPVGPAPTNLQVSSTTPTRHGLIWSFTRDDRPASFEISRRDPDGWKFIARPNVVIDPRQSASGVYSMSFADRSFVSPNSAYRVVAIYSDGRQGGANVEYPNPPQPQRPTGLIASQIAPERVRLEWRLLPHQDSYVVYGPGLTAAGRKVAFDSLRRNFGLLEIDGVPSGVHEYRVATDYSDYIPGINDAPGTIVTNVAPIYSSVTVGVNTVVPAPPPAPAPAAAAADLGSGIRRVQDARPPAIQSPQTLTPTPAGPPPTLISFTSENARSHSIYWTTPSGAQDVDVFRQAGDQWILVEAGVPLSRHSATDRTFVAPGTVYRLVANYADGRKGEVEATLTNPKQPITLSNLKAEQTDERTIKLTWNLVPITPGLDGLRLLGPGLPSYGLEIGANATSATLPHLPEGRHRFVVAASYDGELPATNATVEATVATWRGRYRVVLLGFRVGRKTTDDDILDGDGRGDEVFFGAYRATSHWTVYTPRLETDSLGIVQTVVLGDDNNRPSRMRTGTAGPTGGIRSGDSIPSGAALQAQPGVVISTDRLPLLLWEGDLANPDQPILIALTAFEWDNDNPAAWNAWQNFWSTTTAQDWIRVQGRAAVDAAPQEIRFLPLTPVTNGRYATISVPRGPSNTRPIGALKSADGRSWDSVPHGFALVRSNIEKALGAGSVAVIEASLSNRRAPGSDNPAERDEAEYTVRVQIERLSPSPVKD